MIMAWPYRDSCSLFFYLFSLPGAVPDWFPLAGLTSENWDTLSWWGRIPDYLWHVTLPVIAMTIGVLPLCPC
ncbi:MAG: hypothetical protein CM1200mP20_13790 [Pseudomonadota bacterium]|nr:MAG: hypothetical protein CM1200mP20_13790 [Pseudomonadota bacterium]